MLVVAFSGCDVGSYDFGDGGDEVGGGGWGKSRVEDNK